MWHEHTVDTVCREVSISVRLGVSSHSRVDPADETTQPFPESRGVFDRALEGFVRFAQSVDTDQESARFDRDHETVRGPDPAYGEGLATRQPVNALLIPNDRRTIRSTRSHTGRSRRQQEFRRTLAGVTNRDRPIVRLSELSTS